MDIILVGLVVALTVSRSWRNSKARNARVNAYYISSSYRAKRARALGMR